MTPFVSLLVVVLLVLLAPAAEADRLLYGDHLAVYDATGKQVGSTWPLSEGTWHARGPEEMIVEFRLGSIPVQVRLTPEGFESTLLRFSHPGCTGQALIDASRVWLSPFTAVAGPRSTVYVVQSGPVRERTARSTLTEEGVCNNHEPLRRGTVLLKATRINLADHFVPPFTTQTRGRIPVPRRAP